MKTTFFFLKIHEIFVKIRELIVFCFPFTQREHVTIKLEDTTSIYIIAKNNKKLIVKC